MKDKIKKAQSAAARRINAEGTFFVCALIDNGGAFIQPKSGPGLPAEFDHHGLLEFARLTHSETK